HRQDFEAMLKKKYGKDVVFDKKYGQKKQLKIDFSSPFAAFRILGEMFGQGKKKASGKAAVATTSPAGQTLSSPTRRPSPARSAWWGEVRHQPHVEQNRHHLQALSA
ncbi:MAG TPA: hypothetical protein VH643_30260, partial [Gemmataceae bacterium]